LNPDYAIALEFMSAHKGKNSVVVSDSFFKPFSESQRVKLRSKLIQNGWLCWPTDSKHGLVAAHKTDPHLVLVRRDAFAAGYWQKEDQVIPLGFTQFKDCVGKM